MEMRGKWDRARKAKLAIFIFFSLWLLSTIIAPFTMPSGSVKDLSGVVGRIDNAQQIEKMNPFAAAIYFIGDLNCHQIADRSYFLNSNEMPFCVRDTGIFIGLAMGMLIALVFAPKFNVLLVGILVAPIILDGGAQLVSSYDSISPVRFLTGILGGMGASLLLAYVADRSMDFSRPIVKNKDEKNKPELDIGEKE